MKEIKFEKSARIEANEDDAESYYLVEYDDGVLRCSCGRELVKKDEETYECSGGLPVYKLDMGEIMIDKWGRLMLKKKPHKKSEEEK